MFFYNGIEIRSNMVKLQRQLQRCCIIGINDNLQNCTYLGIDNPVFKRIVSVPIKCFLSFL
jgi:hypothetical protein